MSGNIRIGTIALIACRLSPLCASPPLLLSPDGATVYDTANNINWLANSNLAATNRFGLAVCTVSGTQPCVNPSGSMSYQAAAAWVKAMNAANYLGHSNWQIPTTPPGDFTCSFSGGAGNAFGWGCSASAFGSLYNALGLSAPNTAVPVPNITAGPFNNFQPDLYWSQTSLPQPPDQVGCCGTFSFNSGWQGSNITSNFLFLLPMIQGKIPGTPAAIGAGLQVNPGGQTVYDPNANVTWLANANLAASNTFGLPPCQPPGKPQICVSQDGAMNFNSAGQFIQNMNTAAYLGQSNWQIPTVDPSCSSSYLCSVMTAPFQSLYYSQLGLAPGTPVVSAPDIAVGPFTGIRPYLYWACEANTVPEPCQTSGPAPGFEWNFWFGNGFEGTDVFAHDMYVTAYFLGPPFAFFSGQVNLSNDVYYLQFPDNNLFGYYSFLTSSIFYHYDMGYEALIPGSASDFYLYDFASGHWLYTSPTLFPYLYDFTLNSWIYYFPNIKNQGHYTTNPRAFSNLTTGKTFTM